MSSKFILLALLVTGIINALPVIGLLSAAKMQSLYGTTITDPNLLMLMRHRALLFGLLGGYVLLSIFIPAWRLPAMTLALLSMLGFIALAFVPPGHNAPIRRVAMVDIGVCLALIPALWLQWQSEHSSA